MRKTLFASLLVVGAVGFVRPPAALAQSVEATRTYALVGLIEERGPDDEPVAAEAVRDEVRALLRSSMRARGFERSRTPALLLAVQAQPVAPEGAVLLSLLALEPLPPEAIAFGREQELFYADGAGASLTDEGRTVRQYMSEEHMYTYGRIVAHEVAVAEPGRLGEAVDDLLGRALRWTPDR